MTKRLTIRLDQETDLVLDVNENSQNAVLTEVFKILAAHFESKTLGSWEMLVAVNNINGVVAANRQTIIK